MFIKKGDCIMARKVYHVNSTDTWSNDDKEQLSLLPGSDGFEEYQEDLREHDPFKPEDDFHEELEEHNEDYAENMSDRQEVDGKGKTLRETKHQRGLKLTDAEKAVGVVNGLTGGHYGADDVEDEVYDTSVTSSDFIEEAVDDHKREKRELPEIKQEVESDEYDGPGMRTLKKYM